MSHHEEPPTHTSPEGAPEDKRITYLPEPVHWFEEGVVPFNVAARVTAVTVARWADRYRASSPWASFGHQEGVLPPDSLARPAFVEALVTDLARLTEFVLTLFRRDEALLEQSPGVPGVLRLTAAEFVMLQDAWRAQGLPPDLYYPAHEQRVVIEPVTRYGGVVRVKRGYSPRRWAAHPQTPGASVSIPSKAARQRIFSQEKDRFHQAIMLRVRELSEVGRHQTPRERAEGEALWHVIKLLNEI